MPHEVNTVAALDKIIYSRATTLRLNQSANIVIIFLSSKFDDKIQCIFLYFCRKFQ